MSESKCRTVVWFHLECTSEDVWKKLTDFFSDAGWETFAGTLQLGLHNTPEGVTWIDSESTSVDAVLKQIARSCKQERRFSVTCRCENVIYTFLPPSREGSTVSHPLWQVLVAHSGTPQLVCTSALTTRLLAHGFVEKI